MAERYLGRLSAPASSGRKAFRAAAALFLGTWWSVAAVSGYRAIYQVRSLELSATGRVLRPGATVRARIATSGRTHAHLNVALVQGAHRELLVSRFVPGNRDAATDPRSQRAAVAIVLTPQLLARFRPGPATLRAVGLGSSQWLRVPPPTVREIPVRIAAVDRPTK
jgi:hypothetical protein